MVWSGLAWLVGWLAFGEHHPGNGLVLCCSMTDRLQDHDAAEGIWLGIINAKCLFNADITYSLSIAMLHR